MSATAFYVFVYTMWLKRRSSQNIVIGGAAGAVPVLVGWAAVTGSLGWPPVVLFAIIFFWTPPHFWALAVRYRDDYEAAARADAPRGRLAAPDDARDPRLHVVLWAVTVLFGAVASMGRLYGVAALVLGGLFTFLAARLYRDARADRATCEGDEALRLLDHLPHAPLRRDGRRCPRPVPLRTTAPTPAASVPRREPPW